MGRKARLKRERRLAKTRDAEHVLRTRLVAAGTTIVDRDPELPKISDALVDLVQPLVDELSECEELTRLWMQRFVQLAATVWNATLLPDCDSILDEVRSHVGDAAIVDLVLHRRRALYPDDRRFVTDFEVTDRAEDDEFRVSAAYTFLKPRQTS
jgi:hypothetical protein